MQRIDVPALRHDFAVHVDIGGLQGIVHLQCLVVQQLVAAKLDQAARQAVQVGQQG